MVKAKPMTSSCKENMNHPRNVAIAALQNYLHVYTATTLRGTVMTSPHTSPYQTYLRVGFHHLLHQFDGGASFARFGERVAYGAAHALLVVLVHLDDELLLVRLTHVVVARQRERFRQHVAAHAARHHLLQRLQVG